MAHFAKVLDGIVQRVIVAEQDYIDQLVETQPGEWIQTSYNTRGGVHSGGGTPLRKNFAGIGYHYDADADAFYEPQPYPSWTLNTTSYVWEPPVAHPGDGAYTWNESSKSWDEVTE
tara:strand:+ start:481 stop:828 length:348 start_codon:yes stop_codon:yes gene_type:complete